MLILTRKLTEKIIIGDDIEIVLLGIKSGQVRIGITAPKTIGVHREEVYNRILAQQKKEKDNE